MRESRFRKSTSASSASARCRSDLGWGGSAICDGAIATGVEAVAWAGGSRPPAAHAIQLAAEPPRHAGGPQLTQIEAASTKAAPHAMHVMYTPQPNVLSSIAVVSKSVKLTRRLPDSVRRIAEISRPPNGDAGKAAKAARSHC